MPMNALDAIDRRILEALQTDGRLTNVELADRVGLSPSPCLRRVKRLEADGIITGYRAAIDPAQVGIGVRIFVGVTIDQGKDPGGERFRGAILGMDEVVACHIVSGESDFLVEVLVPDLQSYTDMVLHRLLKVPGVITVRSNFALETVKSTDSLPLAHLLADKSK